jgi:alpha-galactosidase
MLEVGNGGNDRDEYRAHRACGYPAAPLIAGNDLRTMSDETRSILTNPEVLAVGPGPARGPGIPGQLGTALPSSRSWAKPLQDGSSRRRPAQPSGAPAEITAWFHRTGVTADSVLVRDLWAHVDLGAFRRQYKVMVPAHGVVMLRVRPK